MGHMKRTERGRNLSCLCEIVVDCGELAAVALANLPNLRADTSDVTPWEQAKQAG